MSVMIALSLRSGLPWEYWARQDDRVIATAAAIVENASKGDRRPDDDDEDEPADELPAQVPGQRKFRVMSG